MSAQPPLYQTLSAATRAVVLAAEALIGAMARWALTQPEDVAFSLGMAVVTELDEVGDALAALSNANANAEEDSDD